MTASTLKEKTARSLFWSFVDKFGQQIINFASMLVLMNTVATEAYGMFGALALFTSFSGILIDGGFGRVLINRKDLSSKDYSSVFFLNIGLGAFFYLLLFFLAPFIADLFHTSALTDVARVLFIAFFLNAFSIVPQTILTKKADFKGITKWNFWALFLADIAAIGMSFLQLQVWALVTQVVLYAFFRTLFLWIYSGWRPVRKFCGKRLRLFFGFGNRLLLTSMVVSIINNLYPSLIALFYPLNRVAFFNQAKKYQEIPFLMLSNTFRQVAMLILSEVNEDQERMERVFVKFIKSVAFLAFPVGFLMVLVAEPLFFLFFKEKWLPAVPYFQILTFAGMFSPYLLIFHELFISRERSELFLGLEIAKGAILMLLIYLFFPKGIMGLSISWVLYTLIATLLSAYFSCKVIPYSFFKFARDVSPYLILSAISAAISHFATLFITNRLLFILVNTIMIGLLYVILCKLFRLEMTKEIDEWFVNLKRKKNN